MNREPSSTYDPDFDGQRMVFHPAAVAHWIENGVTRGPLYAEIDLVNRCNCNCIFCGVDFRVNQGARWMMGFPDATRLVRDLKSLGCRAVLFSGDGEPLMNPDAGRIVAASSRIMSTALTTNGTLFNERTAPVMDGLKWLRFSINAYGPDSYARVHGCAPEMFDRAVAGLHAAVARKHDRGLDVTIGVQAVLLDENAGDMIRLARLARSAGADYFSLKPYSRHPLSAKALKVNYDGCREMARKLTKLDTGNFRTICRSGSFTKVGGNKSYERCLGAGFMCFVASDGNVYQCNVFAGDKRFLIGNVRERSLAFIWKSERREAVAAMIEHMDLANCRDVCRMDSCNKYLWRLAHPMAHDDFV